MSVGSVGTVGADGLDRVVTGEAVVLEARPTSVVMRMLGAALDMTAISCVALGALLLALSTDQELTPATVIVALVLTYVGLPTAVETLTRGRSLGKLATGTRVVRDDGGPVRFRQAFVRALVGVGELWITAGSVAIITSLVNAKGKRLGDLLAGTYVVRVRGARSVAGLPPVDPGLAAWARTADVARLPDGLALAARQFLGRAAGMDPASRARVGLDLAGRVERYVAPGPPFGTHPEIFVAAVLGERRDRDRATATRRLADARGVQSSATRLPFQVPDPPR